jgi:hypothetical protein
VTKRKYGASIVSVTLGGNRASLERRRTMKKIILASVSAIALMGLAACNDNGGTDNQTTQSTTPPATTAPAAPSTDNTMKPAPAAPNAAPSGDSGSSTTAPSTDTTKPAQ